MTECNCTLHNNWDPQVDACRERSDNGSACTKPEGHTGKHSACTPGMHPIEVWE